MWNRDTFLDMRLKVEDLNSHISSLGKAMSDMGISSLTNQILIVALHNTSFPDFFEIVWLDTHYYSLFEVETKKYQAIYN